MHFGFISDVPALQIQYMLCGELISYWHVNSLRWGQVSLASVKKWLPLALFFFILQPRPQFKQSSTYCVWHSYPFRFLHSFSNCPGKLSSTIVTGHHWLSYFVPAFGNVHTHWFRWQLSAIGQQSHNVPGIVMLRLSWHANCTTGLVRCQSILLSSEGSNETHLGINSILVTIIFNFWNYLYC
jgi:hypothetical protein